MTIYIIFAVADIIDFALSERSLVQIDMVNDFAIPLFSESIRETVLDIADKSVCHSLENDIEVFGYQCFI